MDRRLSKFVSPNSSNQSEVVPLRKSARQLQSQKSQGYIQLLKDLDDSEC